MIFVPRVTRSGLGAVIQAPKVRRISRYGRRGLRGLGDCTDLPGVAYNGVPYCRDNVTGGQVPCSSPACAPASGGAAAGVYSNPAVLAPSFEGATFFGSPESIETLDSQAAQWAASVCTFPSSLQGQDPVSQLRQILQERCAVTNTPDCSNIDSLAQSYGSRASQCLLAPPVVYTPQDRSGGAGAGPGAAAGSGASGARVTAAIQNLSRPGQSFQVGDQWQITVSGAASQPVSGSATKDGASLGTTPFGSTDASGQRVLTGSFGASTVGSWVEVWSVGGVQAPPISFTVAAASSPSGAGSGAGAGAGSSGGGAGSGGSSSGGGGGTSSPGPDAGASSALSFLGSSFSVGSYQVPVWGVLAAVVGVGWMISGRR